MGVVFVPDLGVDMLHNMPIPTLRVPGVRVSV